MLAIVPARCGSKGLKDKNIKLLDGKPLIAHTITKAKKSKYISDIIISTDCKKIEDIAISYGAKSHFLRPKDLASDTSSVIDAYIYTIDRLNSEFGYNIDEFMVLQPTSPLREVVDIDSAIELFRVKNADSVVGYTVEDHPISWHKYINKDLTFTNIFEENLKNRQEVRETYYPNGAIFIFKYDIIKEKKYYTKNSYAYIMPKSRSVDIDTIDDFLYAEFLLNKAVVYAKQR